MFRNSAPPPSFQTLCLPCLRTTSELLVRKSERTRQNAQISILTRRNPSSFIEDIQTFLPLFQGNIRCLLPVVVAEYLYL